jgi:plasmid stabilization system protein ParE
LTYDVTVRPQAEVDLAEAQSWYDDQRPGLGTEFREAVDQLLARLAETPLIYPVVHKQAHRAVLRRFPYLLYFTVSANSVIVLGCLHGKRDPRHARSRIR